LAALVLVLILAVSSSVWFSQVKANYVDDTAAVTVIDE